VKRARIEVDGQALAVVVEGNDLVAADGARYPVAKARFLPPVIPANFYAAGLNYRAHIEWANRHHGGSYKVPTQADIGYRSNNALVGSGADILIPRDSSGPVEFEGELVAVIGTKAKNIPEDRALECVLGYTLGNDVSERTWQRSDRTLWRAKNADTFKPMGPFIVDGVDPMNQQIDVRINGSTVSSYNTRDMIFGVAHYIARMSRYVTLHPGDVIWFGCDGPTVPALQPGDLVEVANPAIGVLANRVRRDLD
jgi:2-keto-4-pentenoate hydratase/2-oxohepta-3-ene-1,7-dioic acid hydratase in catechol pathway